MTIGRFFFSGFGSSSVLTTRLGMTPVFSPFVLGSSVKKASTTSQQPAAVRCWAYARCVTSRKRSMAAPSRTFGYRRSAQ